MHAILKIFDQRFIYSVYIDIFQFEIDSSILRNGFNSSSKEKELSFTLSLSFHVVLWNNVFFKPMGEQIHKCSVVRIDFYLKVALSFLIVPIVNIQLKLGIVWRRKCNGALPLSTTNSVITNSLGPGKFVIITRK